MASGKVDEKTILKAAARVFAEKGWSGARVDEIAAEAGLNKAMLYYRVGDKEELYRRVVLQGQELFKSSVERAIAGSSGPEEAVNAIIEAIAMNAGENRLVPSIILREIAGGGATLPGEGLDGIGKLMELIRNLINEGVEKGVFRKIDPGAFSSWSSVPCSPCPSPGIFGEGQHRVHRGLSPPAKYPRPCVTS